MKRYVHEATPMDMLNAYADDRVETSSKVECSYDEELGQYEFVRRKQVPDSDGFYTDYTLYYDVLNDRYVTVFGDYEIYKPEDEDFDAEFDTESEALDWFENYEGFDYDEDDLDSGFKW